MENPVDKDAGRLYAADERGLHMNEILTVLAVIAVWYALQAYILPKLGIST